MFVVKRDESNPIISPNPDLSWQNMATFNGCPVKIGNKTYCLYRAISSEDTFFQPGLNISIIGIAESSDGQNFTNHRKLIEPVEAWEKYSCEDPRVVFLEGKYYIFYTAISNYPITPDGIKIAVAISDDLKTISERRLVTPFNAKAMSLFPEKINGKYTAILTANTDYPPSRIAIRQFDALEDLWNEEKWKDWYKDLESHSLVLHRDHNDQVELGAPPIKTKDGWLVIYSHIQKYFSSDKVFGIEAVLLDLNDPTKMIGRTDFPIIIPETVYEHYGMIPSIVFPSGSMIEGENLIIYYGAVDTIICKASVNLEKFLEAIKFDTKFKLFKRGEANPIISPNENEWEKRSTFNPAAIEAGGKIHIFYRAQSWKNTSTFGYANTTDGVHIDERLNEPVYLPRLHEEQKHTGDDGFSGCEDPRMTTIGDKIYATYTAYDGLKTHVAITAIKVEDLINKNWNWDMPTLLTPLDIDDKNSCLLPEKVDGKYLIFHRINHIIVTDYLNSLTEKIDHSKKLFGFRRGMWDSAKVG